MITHCIKRFARVMTMASIFTIMIASAVYAQQLAEAAGPFAGLNGSWSGNGIIKVSNGNHERIRCRVNYDVQNTGNNFAQELRCASDSYKFELTCNVVNRGGNLSGLWTEKTRNIGGNVSGRASSEHITGLVESSGFSAELSITTRGDNQSVTIQPRGIDVSEVSISLHRGSK